MSQEKRTLFCKLTDEEIQDKGRLVAAKSIELGRLEVEKKATMAALTEQIKQIKAQVVELSAQIDSGEEPRSVMCERTKDTRKGEEIVVRNDTGAVIFRKKLSKEELDLMNQQPLFADDKSAF
jgi:hypothetical protein